MQAGEPLNAFLSKYSGAKKGPSLKQKLAAAFSAAKRKK